MQMNGWFVRVLVLAVLVPTLGRAGASATALVLPIIEFLLGGTIESSVPGAAATEACQRIGEAMAAWLSGIVTFIGLVGAAETSTRSNHT